MANKIISFGNSGQDFLNPLPTEDPVDMQVFADISLKSSPAPYIQTGELSAGDMPKGFQTTLYKVEKSINVKAIFNSLRNIFTWLPGERILLPEFGSKLKSLLYEGITPQTEEAIMAEIRGCVSEWEPRVNIIEVRDISTIEDTEDNTIHIEVIFTIPLLSDQQYSYSFSYNVAE